MSYRSGETPWLEIPSVDEVNVMGLRELEALISEMNDQHYERFKEPEFKSVFWRAVDRQGCLISDQSIRKRQRNELIELSRKYKHNKKALVALRRSTKVHQQGQRAEFRAAREEIRRTDGGERSGR